MKALMRRKKHKPCGLLSLPAEIRQLIYSHYFAGSQVHYSHRTRPLSTILKRKATACINGPASIALLQTNKTIHREGLLVLQSNITLIFDRIEFFRALYPHYDHASPPQGERGETSSPFPNPNPLPALLSSLITHTRHIVFSSPGQHIPELALPSFPHLQSITIFGFWPRLRNFLSHDHNVCLARRFWYLDVNDRWRLRFMDTMGPHVDMAEMVRTLHDCFDVNVNGGERQRVEIRLQVWALESVHMMYWPPEAKVIEIQADLDDWKRRWTWESVAFPEMKGWKGRWGYGCRYPYVASKTWERFQREGRRRKVMAVERREKKSYGEAVSGKGRRQRRFCEGQVLDEIISVDGFEDEDVSWTVDDAQGMDTVDNLLQSGWNDMDVTAEAANLGAEPGVAQEEPIMVTEAVSIRQAAVFEPEHRPAVKDWATITDSGDWQSVRSIDVAFKQWDHELDL